MKKSTLLFSALGMLSTAGIVIFSKYYTDNQKEVINEISIETIQGVHKTLEIKDSNIYPGTVKNHFITVDTKVPGDYEMNFKFKEKNEGKLKEYLDFEMKIDETVVQSSNLGDLFVKSTVKFVSYISIEKPIKISLSYTMPIETGNEAQGTHLTFTLEMDFKTVQTQE